MGHGGHGQPRLCASAAKILYLLYSLAILIKVLRLRREDLKGAPLWVELSVREDSLGLGWVRAHDDQLTAAHGVDVRAVVLDQVGLVDTLHLHVGQGVRGSGDQGLGSGGQGQAQAGLG